MIQIYLVYVFLIIWPFHWVKKKIKIRKAGCESTILNVFSLNFCEPHWQLICHNKWCPGISEIFKPLDIVAGMHFHVQPGTKSCYLYLLMEKPLGHYFQIWSLKYQAAQHRATKKHLFLYPQGDGSGLRKPKKDKHQHWLQLTPAVISPSQPQLI